MALSLSEAGRVVAWLRANGLDPDRIPHDEIAVSGDGLRILYRGFDYVSGTTELQCDEFGRVLLTEWRAAPVRVAIDDV